jgi:DNA repair protein SbcC/Rad50
MEINYPRIHSLSTIGIKQHFNCDYLFHPRRTDFCGESGSGKSMVADMIQLILVGSSVYKSSTDSNRTREAKGMVMEAKGEQYGIGYIFLNVEIHLGKYVVIGSYIESSHNRVQPFIIQEGYDWDELTPLSNPFYFKNLFLEEKLFSIDILQNKLTNVHLKTFPRKKYHQLLYNNHILSLDLSNDQTLESYASILRSFSRGKGFEKDSESLKKFLFGDDDQNKLLEKYREEVKAINNDFFEHQRYLDEINLIQKKQNQLKEIVNLHKECNELKVSYLTNNCWYWNKQSAVKTIEFEKISKEFIRFSAQCAVINLKEAELELEKLRELERLRNIRTKHPDDINELAKLKERLNEVQKEKNIVELVKKWINNNGNSIENVKTKFLEVKQNTEDKKILSEFTSFLIEKKQLEIFESSGWYENFVLKQEHSESELLDIQKQINDYSALSVFSSLNDTDSLAYWAKDNLSFPVSHEIESILIHFQKLQKNEPDNPKNDLRYLPFPQKLFDNLVIKDKVANGFWVDIIGIYEFIEYSSERYLNIMDPANLSNLLSQINTGIKEKLIELTNIRDIAVELKNVLFEFSGLKNAVNLYVNKAEIESKCLNSEMSISNDEFEKYLKLYDDSDRIIQEFECAEIEYTEENNRQINLNKSIEEIESHFNLKTIEAPEIENLIQTRNDIIENERNKLMTLSKDISIPLIQSNLFTDNISIVAVLKLQVNYTTIFSEIKKSFDDLQADKENALKKLKEAKYEYLIELKQDFEYLDDEPLEIIKLKENIETTKQQFIITYERYKTTFDFAKDSLEDQSLLEGYSIGILANRLLPTIFETSLFDETMVDTKIAERLTKLTRDIQEIGSRKIEILKRVFDQVYRTYSQYIEKVNGIDNYLRKTRHKITGGNKASLTFKKSTDFPDKWMAPLRKQLDDSVMNIGLFKDIEHEVDIDKMMIKVFQESGGNNKRKVTPESLLNPKSYFDLEFDLKFDTGKSNAGSQGQTYTANALLGLARLSLIEDKNQRGLKIMPIDEAEGLGGNYDMLHELAIEEKYQVVSMSIETAGNVKEGEQYIYIMNENNLADETSYVPPLGIFSDKIIDNVEEFLIQQNFVTNG